VHIAVTNSNLRLRLVGVLVKRRMTRAEVRAFAARWKLVNAREERELRLTSSAQKLRQLAVLMASADELGWTKALAAEEEEVRRRWLKLRKAYGL
jgi:hypothetical protein